MKPLEILSKEIELLELDLLKGYKEKGMESSGNWGRSLESKVYSSSDGITGTILADAYSQQLEIGRKSGKFPPREQIENWIVEKGISARIENEITISSLAFLIARKIAREGWDRKDYGGVELVSDVVTPRRIQDIINKVGQGYVRAITTDIIISIKNLAA